MDRAQRLADWGRERAWGSFVVVLLVVAVYPQPAHAYLDAGTGSMIIQAVLALIMGASFLLKTYWRRIKAALGIGRSVDQSLAGEDDATEQDARQ